MLLCKPRLIPNRERQDCLRPVTSTKIYSLANSCITIKSPSGLACDLQKPTPITSVGHGDTNSADETSAIYSSSSRTSLDSTHSDFVSSNTSILENSTIGSDKFFTRQIEAEVDRIGTEIAQSSFMNVALCEKHWSSSVANLGVIEQAAALPMPHMQDLSLALTDPHVLGDPIFMSSAGFEVGPAGLQIGQCSYLNLPAGDCSTMRVIGPTACPKNRPRFQLIMTTAVMDVRTINRHWKLCLIYDVTEAINEMATARFMDDLEAQSTEDGQPQVAVKFPEGFKSADEPFDWNAFIEDELKLHDNQSLASNSTKEAHSTGEFLDAPADIARFIESVAFMRAQAKKFFILTPRPLEHRKRALAQVLRRKKSIWAIEIANLSVSFVSGELLEETEVLDRLASHLRRCTAESVTQCFDDGEGFEWRATLRPEIETTINCFPVDNGRTALAREVWWVCFVEV